MKKHLLGVLFLLVTFFLNASPVNNPAFPKLLDEGIFASSAFWISARCGYEGNFVSNSKLELTDYSRNVDYFKIIANTGTFTINFAKRCDIFGAAGAASIKSQWRTEPGINSFNKLEALSKSDLTWSAGTKIIFIEWVGTSISAGGRYFFTKPSLMSLSQNGAPISFSEGNVRVSEWQVDLGISHKIDLFTPYIGAKYSRLNAVLTTSNGELSDNGANFVKMNNKNKYGMVLGVALTNGKIFMLNIEARLIDEEAATITGEFKF